MTDYRDIQQSGLHQAGADPYRDTGSARGSLVGILAVVAVIALIIVALSFFPGSSTKDAAGPVAADPAVSEQAPATAPAVPAE